MCAAVACIGTVRPVNAGEPASRLAFAAYRNGQWDIFSIRPDGTDLRQLTDQAYEERDPAYSPDGGRLAFASRRDRNWDIYVLDLEIGDEMRLTDDPAYDGAPAWSPDGTRIAYESARAGDLDIWVLNLADAATRNLTADSEAGDFGPAWSPDGRSIAFTSWRAGDSDLLLIDVGTGELTQLRYDETAEEWPAWQPDGRQLAYVRNRLGEREVRVMDVAAGRAGGSDVALESDVAAGETGTPVTWFGRDDDPVWAPEGDRIAFLNHRHSGEQLMVRAISGVTAMPETIVRGAWLDGRLSWTAQSVDYGTPLGSLDDTGPSPLYDEDLTSSASGDGEPWDLVEVKNTGLPTPAMAPYLSDRVDDSFLAMRQRLTDEIGYNFLSSLSEAYRPYDYYGEASDYASWHKSGRAIDTLFDVIRAEGQRLEIVRDDMGGDTYWRVYLRCLDQTGACGRPLTAAGWNYSARARTELAPEEGGVEHTASGQYYVDLTALMREYGWTRIPAWDTEEFSWTWHFKAFEYWHFQKAQGLTWYAAMREVIAPLKVEATFTFESMVELGDHPFLVALKGVPLPAPVRLWWRQVRD